MINQDRIVPVTAIDLLSLYALILKASGENVTAQKAATVDGQFEIASATASAPLIADQPVKTLDFAAAVTAATVYFVPALDFAGFAINGEETATTGADVSPDGVTLYSATLASGAITTAKVGV